MDSLDDDMFNFSDDEVISVPCQVNPVEEHLIKRLNNVHDRVERTKNEITDVQDMSKRLLKELLSRAIYGEDASSDPDSDAYTIDGEPTLKRAKRELEEKISPLAFKSRWQRIIDDKWVIGVVLRNTLKETLQDPVFYIHTNNRNAVYGVSGFWYFKDDNFWHRIDEIEPFHDTIVATCVLELPNFDRDSYVESYGTISYKIDEKDLQTAVPCDQLTPEDVVSENSALKFSSDAEFTVLALKAVSVERILRIPLQGDTGKRLLQFLKEKCFRNVFTDVYFLKSTCSLMFSLAEILSIVDNTTRMRVSARSMIQLNILLRLLRDEFPDASIEEEHDKFTSAAMALMEELQMYLDDKNPAEIQRARMKTDLLLRE